ncbi:hypothetical protein BH11BAC6_BH11BAC6_08840 [soil metagenome]
MNDSVREITATSFAPILYLKDVAAAIEFYIKAFDAIELHRWSNDDGSVHVAEMSIQTAVFHLHEEVARDNQLSPLTLGGASVVIGLFIEDSGNLFAQTVASGATATSAVQDYDYGYRQANLTGL